MRLLKSERCINILAVWLFDSFPESSEQLCAVVPCSASLVVPEICLPGCGETKARFKSCRTHLGDARRTCPLRRTHVPNSVFPKPCSVTPSAGLVAICYRHSSFINRKICEELEGRCSEEHECNFMCAQAAISGAGQVVE